MKTKEEAILEIRENFIGTITENSSTEEKFQNQTLRPILKLQNDLLLEVFRNYATKQKGAFFLLSIENKMHYVENAIQKDIKFRNTLKGIVIGMFTIAEYKEYIQNSSSFSKRIISLLIERLKSQIQLFEN